MLGHVQEGRGFLLDRRRFVDQHPAAPKHLRSDVFFLPIGLTHRRENWMRSLVARDRLGHGCDRLGNKTHRRRAPLVSHVLAFFAASDGIVVRVVLMMMISPGFQSQVRNLYSVPRARELFLDSRGKPIHVGATSFVVVKKSLTT